MKDDYYAYVPKSMRSEGKTLQGRNSFIGQYTENWCNALLSPIANKLGLYAIRGVVCEELDLPPRSPADIAFCKKNSICQKPDDVKLIFEVKMSIVSNYKYLGKDDVLYVGDYKTHRGTPSLLRSDSMLKAIGKSINLRVSSKDARKIPIVILGNSPIQESYAAKVDMLKQSGVVQGFWSLHPNPTEQEHIKCTDKKGFLTINNTNEIYALCLNMINNDLSYFSAMLSKNTIGKIISIANLEKTNESKAKKFLSLLNEDIHE